MHLDLDPTSIFEIFKLIDKDCVGELGLNDFVEGCVTYRGTAKAIHIGSLTHKINKMQAALNDMSDLSVVKVQLLRRPSVDVQGSLCLIIRCSSESCWRDLCF